LQIAPDGAHAIYELQSAVCSIALDTGVVRRLVEWGRHPAMSPDGGTIAFNRGEHDLYVQRIGGEPLRVVGARTPDERWRGGSYAIRPRWSPDGRLVWFATSIGRRTMEPRDPAFVASMRRAAAAAERRRAAGTPRRRNVDYEGSIEHAHWSYAHSVGILDLDARRVWMKRGWWTDVAWSPRGH
jgi:hypothetical protein